MLVPFYGGWEYDNNNKVGKLFLMQINPSKIEFAWHIADDLWSIQIKNNSYVYTTDEEFKQLLDTIRMQSLTPKPVTITEVVVKQ